MSLFTIHQARFENGKLQEVVILCRDEPEPPMFFHEEIELTVSEVVQYLKSGDKVYAQWDTNSIPVEVVRLPSEEESIEVMQRGQPQAFQTLANLPCEAWVFAR